MPLGLLWKSIARKMALDRVVFYVFELILILRSHYLRGIDTYDFTFFILQIIKKKTQAHTHRRKSPTSRSCLRLCSDDAGGTGQDLIAPS
jgi:hypothetical protein